MYLQQATFDFLKDLQDNNNREWFQDNKDRYLHAQDDMKGLITGLIKGLAAFDPHITTDIDVAKCMFRIYRDVRFSKDKSPYKCWLAAGISIDGRKLDGPEYYMHVEPNRSFIACGYWRPKKEHLDAIRQEIDYNAAALMQALKDGEWQPSDLSQEDKLSRPPAGYNAADPNIELLKLKSFIILQPLSDRQLTSSDALENLLRICERIFPFKKFLHTAIDND